MNNTQAIEFYKTISTKAIDNPNCVKLAKNTDYTDVDAKFILKYCNQNSEILDIGSGTGLIVNKIYDKVSFIECIEFFKEFSDHIIKSSNIEIVNSNIFDFNTDKTFDVITIFGTMHHFVKDEAEVIYKKCLDWLKPNGKIIIKNQFGIKEDVTVSGYSEEQKTDYFAQYRHLEKEVDLLESIGFKNIKTFDIYPPEANRWDNTHFYAIVASRS